jgi:chromosome segregation ATPase
MQHIRRSHPLSLDRVMVHTARVKQLVRLSGGLVMIAALTLAAAPTPPVAERLQAYRLEVVNEDGQVVFVVQSTKQGGRMEMRNNDGTIVFSAGAMPDDAKQAGLWEQTVHEVAALRRDLTRQRQEIQLLTRQLQAGERENQRLRRLMQRDIPAATQSHDLAQHERELDSLERRIQQLDSKINRLERR